MCGAGGEVVAVQNTHLARPPRSLLKNSVKIFKC
jgi:hypothetical protein